MEAGNRVPADGRLLPRGDARDRGGRPHRGEHADAQGHRCHRRAGRRARRSPLPRVHEHLGHPRTWRDDRHDDRHGHRDRAHRRTAQPDRGRQDAAAEAARQADHASSPASPASRSSSCSSSGSATTTPSTRSSSPASHSPSRRSLAGFRPSSRRSTRRAPGPGRPRRDRQAPALRRDAGIGLGRSVRTRPGTLTLNKMTAREFDDPRTATLQGHRRGLRHHRAVPERRRRTDRPGGRAAADGAVRRRPARPGRRAHRRPDRGRADRAGGQGRARSRWRARPATRGSAEVPFDSDYKFMATFHEMTDAKGRPVIRCFVKGAPDVLIARGGSSAARRRSRPDHRREPQPGHRRERSHRAAG